MAKENTTQDEIEQVEALEKEAREHPDASVFTRKLNKSFTYENKKMYDEINPTYNTLEELPSYWRADINELVDKGIISGVGGGRLGLTHSECKAAVIAKHVKERL